MDIKTSELPNLVGKVLVVQVEVDLDDEDFREITGKCLVANAAGLVVQTRSRSEMIEMSKIIDLDVQVKPRRLVRRWIEVIDDEGLRQHLLDRHGLPFEMVRACSASDAVILHNSVDHSKLGHEHGVKPQRNPGRPRFARPVD